MQATHHRDMVLRFRTRVVSQCSLAVFFDERREGREQGWATQRVGTFLTLQVSEDVLARSAAREASQVPRRQLQFLLHHRRRRALSCVRLSRPPPESARRHDNNRLMMSRANTAAAARRQLRFSYHPSARLWRLTARANKKVQLTSWRRCRQKTAAILSSLKL